ncbi:MAG TPA: VanZ family protein [Steroidobacteraceae bacterium]|nr:VanZ family protein [Steroidobacteraceae bacterium]
MREAAPRIRSSPPNFRPVARWLTVATVILILYGSLFPFEFDVLGGTGFFDLLMGLRFQRTSRGDLVANLLLYAPLGLCLLLSWPAHWGRLTRLFWTLLLGTMLSVGVEMLQVHAPSRVSSLTDVVLNAAGTLGGGLIALIYLEIGSTIRVPGIAPGRPDPVPLGILLLWLGFRLAPFVPTIDWQKYKDALKPLFVDPQFSALDTYRYVVGWLIAGYAIRRLWRREYVLHAFAVIAAVVLLGRIMVVGKVLVPSELLALVICIPASALMAVIPDRRRATVLAILLAGVIIEEGLKPYVFLAQPHSFSWVPFMNSLSDSLEVNYSVLLEKCFWYFSLVWLLLRRGTSLGIATGLTALLLAGIEVTQLWLPERSAEITDPLLALAAGILLGLLERHETIRLPASR